MKVLKPCLILDRHNNGQNGEIYRCIYGLTRQLLFLSFIYIYLYVCHIKVDWKYFYGIFYTSTANTLHGFLSDTEKLERKFRLTPDVRFHDVCDSSISFTNNYSTASQPESYTGGVCFMNRPMKFGEVHIRGKHTSIYLKNHKEEINLEIGLTEIDPDQIRSSVNKRYASMSNLELVNCIPEENEGLLENFHLRLFLRNKNASQCRLEMRLNNDQPKDILSDVPINGSLWLAIDLHGINSITISHI